MTGSFIPDPLSLILSAAALGQALLCAMLLLLAPKPAPHRYWLAAIFAALAALATGPVSAAMSAALYPLAMGLVLAAVYALPPLIWRYTAQLGVAEGIFCPGFCNKAAVFIGNAFTCNNDAVTVFVNAAVYLVQEVVGVEG